MSTLALRSLTGIVFVALLVGGIITSPFTFSMLFALITGLALWEFSTLVNKHQGASVNRLINTVAGVYLFVAFCGYCADYSPSAAFIPYLLSIVYLLVSELYLRSEHPLKNWAYAFASQVYIALAFSMLAVLAFQYNPVTNETEYVWIFPLSIFIFLWTSDTGAYVMGSLLHKRFPAKLFERISPNKSWVGSIGGGLLCLVAAAVLWHFFPERLSLAEWLGLGMVVCIFGTWGDLVESLFKRELGIKDSGRIMPGHGGMLDRFDSSLLAIPAAVLYFYTLQL
ncbi:MAG: phosphatidate cytidylyltransferase [Bacteroidaceae bacterium]|nr:phosphatidate cytidylyltransferase [Bacteroidaceae bacterium]